jgi:hypothetical protein
MSFHFCYTDSLLFVSYFLELLMSTHAEEHKNTVFSETFAQYLNGYALEVLEQEGVAPVNQVHQTNGFSLRVLEREELDETGWSIDVTIEDIDEVLGRRDLLVGRSEMFTFEANPFVDERILYAVQELVERYVIIRKRISRSSVNALAQSRRVQYRD